MRHDGGYVRAAMPLPGREGVIAVRGTWSGGAWDQSGFNVVQYRNQQAIAAWRVVGVDVTPNAKRSPLLLLRSVTAAHAGLALGDVLTFGDESVLRPGGTVTPPTVFTSYDVSDTTLPIKEDASILFGDSRIHGVACVDDQKVRRVLLFHGNTELLPISQTHVVWWNAKQYSVKLKQDAAREVELYFSGTVKLSRLLYTLSPILQFTTGSGHEMLGGIPRTKRGRIKSDVKEMFEPTVSVAPGSVRVVLSYPTPADMHLFVQPNEPLTLLAASLVDISRRDSQALLTSLGERLFSVKDYLGILRNMSRSLGNDILSVRIDDRSPLDIDYSSSEWLSELMAIPESTYVRRGEFYAIDSHRNWCRVLLDDREEKGDWTFKFKASLLDKVKGISLNDRVDVTFRTHVPEDSSSGSGTLIRIEPASDEQDQESDDQE